MVEGAPLLREYTGNGIEGSNPFFSAISRMSSASIKLAADPRVFGSVAHSGSVSPVANETGREFASIFATAIDRSPALEQSHTPPSDLSRLCDRGDRRVRRFANLRPLILLRIGESSPDRIPDAPLGGLRTCGKTGRREPGAGFCPRFWPFSASFRNRRRDAASR